jgi:hypothetical protein
MSHLRTSTRKLVGGHAGQVTVTVHHAVVDKSHSFIQAHVDLRKSYKVHMNSTHVCYSPSKSTQCGKEATLQAHFQLPNKPPKPVDWDPEPLPPPPPPPPPCLDASLRTQSTKNWRSASCLASDTFVDAMGSPRRASKASSVGTDLMAVM